MKKAILPLFFAFAVIAGSAKANYYKVFRVDNEHCFAMDADHEYYRIDDLDFKCGKDAEKMQPNPDKLFKIKKLEDVREVQTAGQVEKRKNLAMGNGACLDGVCGYTYLYKTVIGNRNGEDVIQYYFVKSKDPSGSKTDIYVGALSYELQDKEKGDYIPVMAREWVNYRFDKLEKLPPAIQAFPLKTEEPIVARDIQVYTADGKPAGRVETTNPLPQIPVEAVIPELRTSDLPAATKSEEPICPKIVKQHGRKYSDINCEYVLKNEKFVRQCLLLKVCDTVKQGCDSRKCVAQYQEMGGLDDVSPLMERVKRTKAALDRAQYNFSKAEKAAAKCDDTDKNNAENKTKKEKVIKARKVLVSARAEYLAAREKLDYVVQSIYKNSGDRYSCMTNSDAVFKYFYESWVNVLDFNSRFWECSLNGNVDPFKTSNGVNRIPGSVKKTKKKK